MSRVYRISPETAQHERRRLTTAIITLLVILPVIIGLMALYFRLDPRSLTAHDLVSTMFMVGLPCAGLWLQSLTLGSLRIELDDNRITRIQNRPLWGSPSRISFERQTIAHIREVGKNGLMIHGPGRKGRYIDLHIPRTVENYEELRVRLAAWQPVQVSWL